MEVIYSEGFCKINDPLIIIDLLKSSRIILFWSLYIIRLWALTVITRWCRVSWKCAGQDVGGVLGGKCHFTSIIIVCSGEKSEGCLSGVQLVENCCINVKRLLERLWMKNTLDVLFSVLTRKWLKVCTLKKQRVQTLTLAYETNLDLLLLPLLHSQLQIIVDPGNHFPYIWIMAALNIHRIPIT